MSFIFDTSKNETPASIAKKRAIAEAIMGNMAPRRANNVGEGIGNAFASIGQGIQSNVLNRRADKAEQAGTASAQEAWNPIASILAGGGAYPPSMASGASPTSGAATGTSNPQQAASIREGLISRGLPQHVADAFMMNFQDESGLNPGINETSPTVAGSRGGYGLYQLTGPRRREYEAFAQNRGASPDSVDAQLDFLMTELQGSESKAAQSILGAPDTATAAQAIVNNFLRPAEQHRSSRSARYANAGGLPQGQFDERFGGAPQSAADAINSIAPQQQQAQPPMPQESMAMAQPEQMPPQGMPSPFTPQALQQHDQMMGGAFAPQGQAPQQMADTSGAFPPAPSMQQQPQQPQQQGMGMVPMDKLMQAASNPWLSEQQRGIVNMLIKQQMDASNPSNQLDMDYKRAQISALQAKASGEGEAAKVQTSVVLDDGSTVMIMNNGDRRVLSPSGQILSGQEAADAIIKAREYTVQNQTDIAGGRRSGTLNANINLGGQAAGAEKLGEASIKAGVDAWADYGKLQSNIGNLDEAIVALDNGAQSGYIYKMLPNVTEASASLENAMNRMGLDVVGSVTFGALSEGELKLAMSVAVPRDLSPPQLKNWLVKKRDAQTKAADMLASAAQFLTVPGNTINGWIEKNKATGRSNTVEQSTPQLPQSGVIDSSDYFK